MNIYPQHPDYIYRCNSMLQFYLSLLSTPSNTTIRANHKCGQKERFNIDSIKKPLKTIREIKNKLPKQIFFKNNEEKTYLAGIIRKLMITSFYRARCNFNIFLPILTKQDIFISSTIYKNAFVLRTRHANFNICREDKYSKNKSTHFIYDWKEINRCNDNLLQYNLSIEKLWKNICTEISSKMSEFSIYQKNLFRNEYCWVFYEKIIGKIFHQILPIWKMYVRVCDLHLFNQYQLSRINELVLKHYIGTDFRGIFNSTVINLF